MGMALQSLETAGVCTQRLRTSERLEVHRTIEADAPHGGATYCMATAVAHGSTAELALGSGMVPAITRSYGSCLRSTSGATSSTTVAMPGGSAAAAFPLSPTASRPAADTVSDNGSGNHHRRMASDLSVQEVPLRGNSSTAASGVGGCRQDLSCCSHRPCYNGYSSAADGGDGGSTAAVNGGLLRAALLDWGYMAPPDAVAAAAAHAAAATVTSSTTADTTDAVTLAAVESDAAGLDVPADAAATRDQAPGRRAPSESAIAHHSLSFSMPLPKRPQSAMDMPYELPAANAITAAAVGHVSHALAAAAAPRSCADGTGHLPGVISTPGASEGAGIAGDLGRVCQLGYMPQQGATGGAEAGMPAANATLPIGLHTVLAGTAPGLRLAPRAGFYFPAASASARSDPPPTSAGGANGCSSSALRTVPWSRVAGAPDLSGNAIQTPSLLSDNASSRLYGIEELGGGALLYPAVYGAPGVRSTGGNRRTSGPNGLDITVECWHVGTSGNVTLGASAIEAAAGMRSAGGPGSEDPIVAVVHGMGGPAAGRHVASGELQAGGETDAGVELPVKRMAGSGLAARLFSGCFGRP